MNIWKRIKSIFRKPEPPPAIVITRPRGAEHYGSASSFADPADVVAFRKCKATGKSDQECFKVGDNGIGFTGMNCATDKIAICALPPDDWRPRFGVKANAVGAKVAVTVQGVTYIGVLGDTMPAKANIKNGAIIDLNPGFAKLFGLRPPFMVRASWRWVD
jgi:hypothetical protein